MVFSANSQDALKQFAESCLDYQTRYPDRLADLAYTLSQRREHLPSRSFAIITHGKASNISPSVKVLPQKPPLAMAFGGQGTQWPQMGMELLRSDPGFRHDIQTMDDILRNAKIPPNWTIEGSYLSVRSLRSYQLTKAEELLRPAESSRVYQAEISQPLCKAVQIGLVNSWERRGITPDSVIGHSSGEIAAAYAAAALSLREAIIVSYYRGFVTRFLNLKGGMAAVGMSTKEVSRYLTDGVVIAAENSPNLTTISGDTNKLDQVLRIIKAEKADILARRLQVDIAYHSRE